MSAAALFLPAVVRLAETIRASIEALPEHQRQPWEYQATSVYMNGTSHGAVHSLGGGPNPVPGVSGACGELIALLASPDVALALAELLDALEAAEEGRELSDDPVTMVPPLWEAIQDARDALEAAILRSGT